MSEFEEWFKNQDFYLNMRFIHGDKLFDKDGDVYRVLPVQMTFKAREDLQKRIDVAYRLLVEAEIYQCEPNIDLAVKALRGEYE